MYDVCFLLSAVLVYADDVCIHAIWSAVVAALCLQAVFRSSVRCSWSAVSGMFHGIQVCSSYVCSLSVSRVFS